MATGSATCARGPGSTGTRIVPSASIRHRKSPLWQRPRGKRSRPVHEAIRQSLEESGRLLQTLAPSLAPQIERAALLILEAFRQQRKLLIMGNGGSAADAQHLAAELVGRFSRRERRALPALALTTDTSVLTSVGNDFGFESIFQQQIEALAQEGDVVLAISTSGLSENILRGLEMAQAKGARTLALLGRDGGKVKGLVELAIIVPSPETPRIQEVHLAIEHVLCQEIEKHFSA
ncbi:MAG: D-sedoheptulose 7-phosphate isomerase [Candidatus Tectomicrobia bacterium]|uniref:Phosphoheptose isomerase n=1 Tax=Tectimicrobiota bacterium TaxID=2528274 RepID=A0A932FW00_UNCTE|nr:D-sedoheptulose 7-phosphate isomerase [Candidatus Tectomicrobia bacterium]